jgi:hypothetical protein
MAYVCEVGTGRRLYLNNENGQTTVTISSSQPGQNQQASSSFHTGAWKTIPEVYLTADGAVVKLQTTQAVHYIRIQGSSIGVSEALSLENLHQMQMQQVSGAAVASMPSMPPMKPMEPMKPMPPMPPMQSMQSNPPAPPVPPGTLQMGDMQMSMDPMTMKLGNMEMKMGGPAKPQAATPVRRFCSQCGSGVQPSDRFCASCGHRLGE